MRTYVLSTQLGVLCDQLRILSMRKCANFHENRLIYAYLSTRVYIDKVASPWQTTRNSYTRSFSAIPASLPLILEEQIVSTAHYFSDGILFSKGMCTLIPEAISDIPLYHWAQAIFCEFPNVYSDYCTAVYRYNTKCITSFQIIVMTLKICSVYHP